MRIRLTPVSRTVSWRSRSRERRPAGSPSAFRLRAVVAQGASRATAGWGDLAPKALAAAHQEPKKQSWAKKRSPEEEKGPIDQKTEDKPSRKGREEAGRCPLRPPLGSTFSFIHSPFP